MTRSRSEAADRFIQAGKGVIDISTVDVQAIGMTELPQAGDWSDFCRIVFKHVTGRDMEPCRLVGRGSASRWYGEQVAKAIRETV